jgi:hypothetical protein
MNKKRNLIIILIAMSLIVTSYIAFTCKTASALKDKCEWCWFRYCESQSLDICFDGCLVPPSGYPIMGVKIYDTILQTYNYEWVLCVLEDDSTCSLPCRHYTSIFHYSDLDPEQVYTGEVKIIDSNVLSTLCIDNLPVRTPFPTATPTVTPTP